MPHEPKNKAQRKLMEKHGSPRMFAQACVNALGEISCLEADAAIEKYRRQWEAASKIAVLFLAVFLCSCQLATHESHASATKWEKDTNITWGGTTHTTGADGWDNATDHNASFQVAAQTAGTTLTAYIGYLTTQANYLLQAMQNKNLTTQQIASLKYQYLTTHAQLTAATKQAAINAGLAPSMATP